MLPQFVSQVLSLVLNDKTLALPIFMPDIRTEEDAYNCNNLPLIYIWNEDKNLGSFTVSVNGTIVRYLLESLVSCEHPQFVEFRDQIQQLLSDSSKKAILNRCKLTGLFPSDCFYSYSINK